MKRGCDAIDWEKIASFHDLTVSDKYVFQRSGIQGLRAKYQPAVGDARGVGDERGVWVLSRYGVEMLFLSSSLTTGSNVRAKPSSG